MWFTSHTNDLSIDLDFDFIGVEKIEIITAFAHFVDTSMGPAYTVGYSMAEIPYHTDKVDFISNICQAAILSAGTFYSCSSVRHVEELDEKDFFFMDVSGPTEATSPSQRPHLDDLSLCSKEVTDIMREATYMAKQTVVVKVNSKTRCVLSEASAPSLPVLPSMRSGRSTSPKKSPNKATSCMTHSLLLGNQSKRGADIYYRMDDLPVINDAPGDLNFEELMDLQQRAFGKNSTIHSATYRGEPVVVKLMMPGLETSSIAHREFDNEQNILRRVSHPNIVHMIGSGSVMREANRRSNLPLRFTVLEWLDGSLHDVLSDSNKKSRRLRKFVQGKKSLPPLSRLQICRDLASALHYLHKEVWPGVSIIHREIEPDNIRLNSDGIVKLTGFGLCVSVRTRETISCPVTDSHGTLRYTAPEVALRLSFSEKTDTYSLAIVMWQLIRDKVPFLSMSKSEFMDRVVYGNERPKLDKVQPVQLAALLSHCWHCDQAVRPSCNEIICELQDIMISGHSALHPPSILPSRMRRSPQSPDGQRSAYDWRASQAKSAPALIGRRKKKTSVVQNPLSHTSVHLTPCEDDFVERQMLADVNRKSAWF